ncbi:transcriptional regulator [Prauserella marina]|uniref:Predicted DNA-binding transcriptional regulator YafY, contains an HTH and WYL domains n=1 Tax=Prauserella marina TaxID=530584 RepID=A0A222VQM8_9PSEU|nr:WYL domain-containing protein [Prauserella marina]ASR36217.1 transcriptional regulator [Prauserella marina]PWV76976.1 putative DNA-binding transcriptional regulator YafY [Prauserella marina]SDD01520.1 Predicted DNA-binding transcriptional regulator YafY, contains an HTH and WYL domains [Prauserella marina]
MADTSRRALRLLSLLGARAQWSLAELAGRLGVSERTTRRDIETLRRLGYPVATVHGPEGGYRLGAGGSLPPLLFDEDQALAVAVALQTAPGSVFGLADDAARALETLTGVMPARLRASMEALRLTRLRNYWEFAAPPIDPDGLTAVGAAVAQRRELVVEVLGADGARTVPGEAGFVAARRVEPHHLVVWAARWYLVAYDVAVGAWRVHRVDRLRARPTTRIFAERPVPGDDVARFVMTSHDRGDIPAAWPCTGSACLDLPARVVARFAPGGSVVEQLDSGWCRLTLGAWSWAGVAGILATFDAELTEVQPPELVVAFRRLAGRWSARET